MNRTEFIRRTISAGVLPLTLLLASAPVGQNPPALQSARTYYVDSVAGNDDQTGTTPAQAWRNLAKVNATTFHPGDRILLKSGSVWRGQLWPKGSGAEGRPITPDMYGGGVKPVIEGAGGAKEVSETCTNDAETAAPAEIEGQASHPEPEKACPRTEAASYAGSEVAEGSGASFSGTG